MTPTAQIAAIRLRSEAAKDIGAVSIAWSQDIPFLLRQIDARESALRALVAQWREEVEEANAKFAAHGVSPLVSTGLQVLTSCANELERFL